MRFSPLAFAGVLLVETDGNPDFRGDFFRVFCAREFQEQGLVSQFLQQSISSNKNKGTVRGMHFQKPPHGEAKLIRCIRGGIFDVLIDLRKGSPTFRRTLSIELTDKNRKALYVPEGIAHGFQTLADDSEVLYLIDQEYVSVAAAGVRWNDPLFGVKWPLPIASISERDESFPDFRE